MADTSALRVQPGARTVTPLCRLAQTLASLTGWRRYTMGLALGVLLAGALPPVDITPLVFIVLPMLIWLDDGSSGPWASARLGYVFGLGYFVAGLYWVAAALFVDIATFWWALPFAVVGLPAFMACYLAVAMYAAAQARFRLKMFGFASICLFATALSASEWLRGHLLTGLPWNLIGYVWAGGFPGALMMLQTTAWIGIYGLTFLTIFAASIPALLGTPSLTPLPPARRATPVVAAALLVLIPAAAGATRLALLPPDTTSIWLRLVQPSITETLKWDPNAVEANFHRLIELSSAPSEHRLTAIIWPEAAATYVLDRDQPHRIAMGAVAPSGGYVVSGALHGPALPAPLTQIWNSIDVIGPAGDIRAQYDKTHLVPFGEYMPMRSILPFKKLTSGSIDLSAGPGPQTIALPMLPPFAPLICYEAIFPAAIVDEQARPAWMLNVSNDAWYGRSSGPYQHFAMARTRAVEEGLPLVRVANNGITGVVDAQGRVRAHTSLDVIGYADVELPITAAATFYARFGDWIFLLILIVGATSAVVTAVRTRTREPQ